MRFGLYLATLALGTCGLACSMGNPEFDRNSMGDDVADGSDGTTVGDEVGTGSGDATTSSTAPDTTETTDTTDGNDTTDMVDTTDTDVMVCLSSLPGGDCGDCISTMCCFDNQNCYDPDFPCGCLVNCMLFEGKLLAECLIQPCVGASLEAQDSADLVINCALGTCLDFCG